MMMFVTYIVGQLSSPIEQLIDFSLILQDAKISLERLGEIHGRRTRTGRRDKTECSPR